MLMFNEQCHIIGAQRKVMAFFVQFLAQGSHIFFKSLRPQTISFCTCTTCKTLRWPVTQMGLTLLRHSENHT